MKTWEKWPRRFCQPDWMGLKSQQAPSARFPETAVPLRKKSQTVLKCLPAVLHVAGGSLVESAAVSMIFTSPVTWPGAQLIFLTNMWNNQYLNFIYLFIELQSFMCIHKSHQRKLAWEWKRKFNNGMFYGCFVDFLSIKKKNTTRCGGRRFMMAPALEKRQLSNWRENKLLPFCSFSYYITPLWSQHGVTWSSVRHDACCNLFTTDSESSGNASTPNPNSRVWLTCFKVYGRGRHLDCIQPAE